MAEPFHLVLLESVWIQDAEPLRLARDGQLAFLLANAIGAAVADLMAKKGSASYVTKLQGEFWRGLESGPSQARETLDVVAVLRHDFEARLAKGATWTREDN